MSDRTRSIIEEYASRLGFRTEIPSIVEFISESKYLGNSFKTLPLYSVWQDKLEGLFRSPFRVEYRIIHFMGPEEAGATVAAIVGVLFDLTRLLNLKDLRHELRVPEDKLAKIFIIGANPEGNITALLNKVKIFINSSSCLSKKITAASEDSITFDNLIMLQATLDPDVINNSVGVAGMIDVDGFLKLSKETEVAHQMVADNIATCYGITGGRGGRLWDIKSSIEGGRGTDDTWAVPLWEVKEKGYDLSGKFVEVLLDNGGKTTVPVELEELFVKDPATAFRKMAGFEYKG